MIICPSNKDGVLFNFFLNRTALVCFLVYLYFAALQIERRICAGNDRGMSHHNILVVPKLDFLLTYKAMYFFHIYFAQPRLNYLSKLSSRGFVCLFTI
jgi:hypothetical protein